LESLNNLGKIRTLSLTRYQDMESIIAAICGIFKQRYGVIGWCF